MTQNANALALAALCFALVFPGAALAALLHSFDDPTPTQGDSFGWSVAIEGNHVVIAAPWDDTHGGNVGQVFLFDATSGSLVRTLDDPTVAVPASTSNDRFGYSVAIDGNRVLVGAPLDNTTAFNNGQAHLFDAATGSPLQVFNDPSPTTNQDFGQSVALSAGGVLIGVPADDTHGSNVGIAHLFDAGTGDPGDVPFFAATSDNFGWSVAIDGSLVLAGAPFDSTLGTNVGRAYLFDAAPDPPILLHTFENPSVKLADQFGFSVAIDAGRVLIGAHGDDTQGLGVGQAYLFDATTGNLLHTFDDPTPGPNGGDEFGRAVAIDGNHVLIGARSDGTLPNSCAGACGQAHLFDATTGNLEQTYDDPFPNNPGEHRFGHAVAIDGNRVLIGAYADASAGSFVGRAYLFDLNGNATPSSLPALSVPSLWICIFGLLASILVMLRRAERSPKGTTGNN